MRWLGPQVFSSVIISISLPVHCEQVAKEGKLLFAILLNYFLTHRASLSTADGYDNVGLAMT